MSTNYSWVRSDLSRPQQVVQNSHAVAQAAQAFGSPSDTNLIVYGVANEDELKGVLEYLKLIEASFYVWREPMFGDRITSICTNVLPDQYEPFKHFQLLV